MTEFENINGLLLDYGGTLDTDGCHWGMKIWHWYKQMQYPISLETYRNVYVYAEKTMGSHHYVNPDDTFFNTLKIKMQLQMDYICREITSNWTKIDDTEWGELAFCGLDFSNPEAAHTYALEATHYLYDEVLEQMKQTRRVLKQLAEQYPLVLVSNFYGNLNTVLKEFGIDSYFKKVVESAAVGIRKPDPAIFTAGVKALKLEPQNVAVIGDSLDKDIIPAKTIGCKTIWLKGETWKPQTESHEPDAVVNSINELPLLLTIKLNK